MEHESDCDKSCYRRAGTVTKELVQRLEDLEIRGRVEIIQTKAVLKSTRWLRSVLETWGDLLTPVEKKSANTGVKNSQMNKLVQFKIN